METDGLAKTKWCAKTDVNESDSITFVALESETLPVLLQLLQQECSPDECTAALTTLLKIHRNIQENPGVEKYRSLRKENKGFNERVWRHDGAQQILFAAGWVEARDSVAFPEGAHLAAAIAALDAELGSSSTSSKPTPVQSSPGAWSDRELSAKEKTMMEERKRQLQNMKREKEERKRISEQIKADRQESNTRESKDSHARKPTSDDSKMKRFSDIGIDVNKGSG